MVSLVYPSFVDYNDRRLINGGFFMLYMSELREYGEYLRDREMSENTVGKYLRDAENFLQFSNGREISRELMMEYKSYILNAWKISSVNSMITAVNSYLKWAGQAEFSIHTCRGQSRRQECGSVNFGI